MCGQLADPKEEIAIFKTCIIGGRLEGHHPKSILIPRSTNTSCSHTYLYTKKSDKRFSNFYFFFVSNRVVDATCMFWVYKSEISE